MLLVFWSIWLGSIVAFSFVLAPAVFRSMERPDAARVMQKVLPRYYLLGVIAGAGSIASALAGGADLRLSIPLVIALVLVAYARQVVSPAATDARQSQDEEQVARLHLFSVRLNMIVLALLLLAGTVILETR